MNARAFTKLKSFFDTIRWGQRSEGNMPDKISLQVHLAFDDEASVWYVSKSDIPGLCLEAKTATDLVEKVMAAAPELLELNEGLLVDPVAARLDEPSLDLPEFKLPASRPGHRVLPVFDSPLELAHA